MHRTQNLTDSAADTDDTPVVTPADILRGAATYLELHGWFQGDYYATFTGGIAVSAEPFPAADVAGALGMAAHGELHDVPFLAGPNKTDCHNAYQWLSAYLADQGEITPPEGDGPHHMSKWNDHDNQSAEHVIAVLRAAADQYDWQHASEDDLETYAENELDNDRVPTREGFLAWRAAR